VRCGAGGELSDVCQLTSGGNKKKMRLMKTNEKKGGPSSRSPHMHTYTHTHTHREERGGVGREVRADKEELNGRVQFLLVSERRRSPPGRRGGGGAAGVKAPRPHCAARRNQ